MRAARKKKEQECSQSWKKWLTEVSGSSGAYVSDEIGFMSATGFADFTNGLFT
jgi:hypothetical protein